MIFYPDQINLNAKIVEKVRLLCSISSDGIQCRCAGSDGIQCRCAGSDTQCFLILQDSLRDRPPVNGNVSCFLVNENSLPLYCLEQLPKISGKS